MSLEDPAVERRASDTEEGDEDRLAQFGYKQELKRDWGLAHNFGVSFSIIVSVPYLYYLTVKLTSNRASSPASPLSSRMA